jgi:hypothetical protein
MGRSFERFTVSEKGIASDARGYDMNQLLIKEAAYKEFSLFFYNI